MLLILEKHPYANITILNNSDSINITYRCNYCNQEYSNSKKNLLRNKYLCKKCCDNQKVKGNSQITIEGLSEQEEIPVKLKKWNGTDNQAVFHCSRCDKDLLRYPSNYIKNPFFCPHCQTPSGHIPKSLIEAQENLDNLFGPEVFQILKYGANGKKSTVKHISCGLIFTRKLHDFKSSRGCPKCDRKKSRLERTFEAFLEESNISFMTQVRFPDLPRFSFDFKINKKNGEYDLVEIQGQQHYKDVSIFQDTLEEVQKRDQIKREYCLANSITLIEIPFWNINNINKLFPPERFNDYLERE
ncbi:MAG: hypothetical protein EOM85_03195 [Candidatus Moranbacteria bacterium]|nr:hypothetical protein [Candidatus Moranbacteria bacterium]